MTSGTSFKQNEGIFICGYGAVTPVGLTAPASAAAVRAGLSGFSEHPFMVDSVGEPMCVAQCPLVESHPILSTRIIEGLVAAIREALSHIFDASTTDQWPAINLMVNLPFERPGLPAQLKTLANEALVQAFPNIFTRIDITEQGHAGSLIALQSAIRTLVENRVEMCIIAGSDSYMDPDMLEWLEETNQLHCAGPQNNAWGFIPGEGAGAIVLATKRLLQHRGINPFCRIAKVGVGYEINKIRTDSVCIGEGLTTAFRDVLAGLPTQLKITDVYCDMNGETYRGDEFGFSIARTRERFVSATDFVAPADCWGDVGAASASLLIILNCIAFAKGYSKGSIGLVWASSDSGERGAAIIEAIGGK